MKFFYYQNGEEVFATAALEKPSVAYDEFGRTWLEYLDGVWRTRGVKKPWCEGAQTASRVEE